MRDRKLASLFSQSIKLKTFSSFPMRSISRPNSMLSLASNLDRSCDMTKGASDVLVTAQPFCYMLFTKLNILAASRESEFESFFIGLRLVISFNSVSINFL